MKKIGSIIIIVVSILIISIGIILGFKTKSQNEEKLEVSEFYLIGTKESKYALFNEKGEQLSDFLYNEPIFDAGNILYLSGKKDSLVFTKEGKILFKNKELEDYSILGSYYHKNKEKDILYNYKGKKLELYDAKKMEFVSASRNYLLLKDDKELKLLDAEGQIVFILREDNSGKEIKLQDFSELAIISLDDTAYVIDTKAKKIINTIISENYLSYLGRTKDLNVYINLYDENPIYEIYHKEEKVRELVEGDCSVVEIAQDNLICSLISDKTTDKIITKNGLNYAEIDGANVKIYEASKLVATIENATISEFKNYIGIYALEIKDEVAFYNSSGQRILSEKKYLRASSFAKDGKAIVSEIADKYYVMDQEGKKLSEEYFYIDVLSSGADLVYRAIDEDANLVVLDAKFKEVYKALEENVGVERLDNQLFYLYKHKNSDKVDVIHPYKGEIIKKQKVEFKSNYIVYDDGKNYVFVNFEGKEITKLKR